MDTIVVSSEGYYQKGEILEVESRNTFNILDTQDLPLREFHLLVSENHGKELVDKAYIRIISPPWQNDAHKNCICVLDSGDSDRGTVLRCYKNKTWFPYIYFFEKDVYFPWDMSKFSEDRIEELKSYFLELAYLTSLIFTRMNEHETLKIDIDEKRVCTSEGKRIAKRYPQHRIVELEKGISIIRSYKRDEKRSHSYHVGEFGVRGHYRHYKSGKVVFIQPFKKRVGKKPSEKTYIVS